MTQYILIKNILSSKQEKATQITKPKRNSIIFNKYSETELLRVIFVRLMELDH